MITTTGIGIEGRPVAEYLGVVTSQAIMGVALGKDVKAWGRGIVGGRSGAYEKEIAKAVSEAMTEIGAAATALGADALIAVAINYESVGHKMLMVAASGTAVRLT